MNELKAIYNLYGDTIEFFTGFGNEEGSINSTEYIDNDICIYRNINRDKKLTSATINNITRLVINNKDILEYIVNNKLRLTTILSYLPKNENPKYKEVISELTKIAKTNRIEVDVTQLVNYLNEEAP